MSSEISWHLELELQSGTLDELRALMEEMVTSSREESGALSYAWFVSDDGRQVHTLERYVDSAAVMTHMATFGQKFAGRFWTALKYSRASIFGSPSDEVRAIFAPFSPDYYAPFGGFVR